MSALAIAVYMILFSNKQRIPQCSILEQEHEEHSECNIVKIKINKKRIT